MFLYLLLLRMTTPLYYFVSSCEVSESIVFNPIYVHLSTYFSLTCHCHWEIWLWHHIHSQNRNCVYRQSQLIVSNIINSLLVRQSVCLIFCTFKRYTLNILRVNVMSQSDFPVTVLGQTKIGRPILPLLVWPFTVTGKSDCDITFTLKIEIVFTVKAKLFK